MKKIILFTCLLVSSISIFANSKDRHFELSKNLEIFNSLYKSLNLHYVDTIPLNKMVKAGIDGMLRNIDPYTVYIPAEKDEDFTLMTTGEYAGVGAIITQRDSAIYINEVYVDMPAYNAGLRAADKIVSVDKTEITKKHTTSQVSEMLRGIPGTEVKVGILHPKETKVKYYNITRKQIYINPITYYNVVADSIGYINLSSFTDNCSSELKKAYLELKDRGIKGLIIDLRNNGGGLLREAINISNFFLPKGEVIVSTKGKNENENTSYKAHNNPIDIDIPLVIMVNDESASASEIVAGAMQDLDRAVIVGNRTFGKGLVQGTFPVAYDGKLKVTTAKYYTPSGRCIQAINYTQKEGEKSDVIPDSLTTEFKTKGGRIVRDGRGITPDVKYTHKNDADSLSRAYFCYELMLQNICFDYATEFTLKNPTIGSIKDFSISDSTYNDFKEFVKSKNFKYENASEKKLKDLIETIKKENYYEESKDILDSLEKKLEHTTDVELDKFRQDVSELLSAEIVKRYYFSKGEAEQYLKSDEVLDLSIEILNDPKRYNEILKGK
jgi:carboxyl-terminal processing protease